MLERFLKATLGRLLKLIFRIELRGLEHYQAAGSQALIICNHQSFLDPLLLALFLPDKPAFAMNVAQAEKWYFKPLVRLVTVYKIDPLQPMSTKTLIKDLKEGSRVVIFPEGRITVTGGIMKMYDGTGLIIDKAGGVILPARIEGAQFTHLSRMKGKLPLKLFPKITLTFLPPTRLDLPESVQGKERREMAAQAVYDLMLQSCFDASPWRSTLLAQLCAARKRLGGNFTLACDIQRKWVSYRSLFTRVFALAGAFEGKIGDKRNVAVMLPTSLAAAVAFLALHVRGRVPAMLNFSAGAFNLKHACMLAQSDTLITSRAFVEKGGLEDVMQELAAAGQKILYLEDMKNIIGPAQKMRALFASFSPEAALADVLAHVKPDDPAVILYTSGSEGAPKGVALSHANMLANIYQAAARLDFTARDLLFNALPVFHSFGLTIGTMLPLVLGIRVFFYPSPLHYRVVPELCYDLDATILLGTDTFFQGYARYAHPFDFHSIRLAVAGAEKLKTETRRMYAEHYLVNILEGYGVTEMSPAMAFNTPLEHKSGTVGRLFPHIEYKLEPIPGMERGGRLWVKGPNLMLGYIKPDQPGVVQPQGEWYDTGDIADIDAQGYVTILGRAKRFAKIGGEMVSLQSVEDLAATLYPEQGHAALAVADERKGEQIVLFSEQQALTRDALLVAAKAQGLPEISLPRKVIPIDAVPRLGSGKIDYPALKQRVAEIS